MTLNDNLTQSQAWYRDYFQGLWAQAKYRANMLGESYRKLAIDQNAINTSEAESIARNLAKTEAEMLVFHDKIKAGLDREEQRLRTELSNADALKLSTVRREQDRIDLQRIADARLGLSTASIGWVPPEPANYSARGLSFSNTDGSATYDNSFIGNVRSGLSVVEGLYKPVVEFFTMELNAADQAALCGMAVDILVGLAIGKVMPAPIPPNTPAGLKLPGDQVWSSLTEIPFKQTGDVCEIYLPRDTWGEELRAQGLSYNESDSFDYFKLGFGADAFLGALNDRYAIENTIQLAGLGLLGSPGDVLTAHETLVADVNAGLGDYWSAVEVKAATTAAQAQAWAGGFDLLDPDWTSALDGDAAYFANLQQEIDGGSVPLDGLASRVDEYAHENHFSAADALANAINTYGPTLTDTLSLIRAIQSGEPLPIVASGIRLANDISKLNGGKNLNLSGAANVASGVLSLLSLDAALEQGDALGALTAGANAVSFGAAAYIDFVGAANAGIANEISAFLNGQEGVTNALGMTDGVLPYLNLVNSIAQGSPVGIVSSTLMLFPGTQPIGFALNFANMVFSLFDDTPDPWGAGRYVWSATGIGIRADGETGGEEAVESVMDATLATLEAMIEQARQASPGSPLGLIPVRMPTVGYDTSGFRYADIDPLTGKEQHPELRFDVNGRPYNAEPGSPESYQSLVEGMVYSALARGAIAPQWEVDTARLQANAGDPRAGLTEEERAGRDGQLAAPLTGTTQTFRPVVLDLDGDGIETVGKANGVAFDVDDSGYLKQSAWVGADDGFLVLDRNYNGQFDTGKELFSNAQVAVKRRGLAALGWVDANYDGRITSADPVWNELKVWRDLDRDGAQDTGEVQSLAQLGVSELDYKLGTYTKNGQKERLGSPDLEADRDGSRISVVPEGILVEQSADGSLSLLVTRVDDLTAVEANRDGLTGFEDIELIVSTADLLDNDSFGGQSDANLTVTGVSGFRRGTGYLDANGFVHFKPQANYFGTDAGFEYSVRAVNGQTGTARVDITLQNVNDAPTATIQRNYLAVYGYTEPDENGNGGGEPIYSPYTETNCYGSVEHNEPVAWEDARTGKVVGADIDDPASSLTYRVIGNPQYGEVTVDAQGNYSYTAWVAPDTPVEQAPSSCAAGSIYPETDAFLVRVTDPHGASKDITVNVPHPEPYRPPRPPGGGGGCCPVAVDLDGNGFAFTPAEDSEIFFDINADGWRRQVSWTKPGDGWLAYDANGNGQVDDGSEMVFSNYAENAQGDLAAIAEVFDSNGDGLLTAADEKWAKFGVWVDANQDGVSDAGEFRSLSDMGVASLSLVADGSFAVQDGNTIHGVATVTMNDGTRLNAADVALRVTDRVLDGSGTAVPQSPFSPDGEVLEGTANKDLILGKTGNNVVYGYAGDDVILEDGGNDFIDAGEGNDMVYAGADNDLVLGGGGDDAIYAGLGDDQVFGGDGHDAIFAEGGNDIVFGGAGNDLISGGWGNDVLSGDDGDDQLYGEAGFDALFGRDGNDELIGMEGNDRLDGGAGADLLDGGSGADEMVGGAGDDIYVVDDLADAATELAGEGVDTVRTGLNGYVLGAHVENLLLSGTENLAGAGNELDNVLTGNIGNNTLSGGAGNDVLDGGAGDDTLIGGTGDDVYVVDDAADAVIEFFGEGIDTVRSRVGYVLPEHMENLALIGAADVDGTGNDLDNRIDGNAGNNRLDGGLGADVLAGGAGDDDYVVDQVGDVVFEQGGEGIDTVFASIDYTLGTNAENVILVGGHSLRGGGNSADNLIVGNTGANDLRGRVGADVLAGMEGNDFLFDLQDGNALLGGAGNDYLSAGEGNDFLAGGIGDDEIQTGGGRNVIACNRGDGNDTVLPWSTADNTLLLGREIDIYDLALRRSGQDLVLETGGDDRVTFKNWYAATTNRNVSTLQFIDGNPWRDRITSQFYHYVETFDFRALVADFDNAWATSTNPYSWSLLDALTEVHLAGSDDAAIGGELSASYADNGLLAMSSGAIQQGLRSPGFGSTMQSVGNRLEEGNQTYRIG